MTANEKIVKVTYKQDIIFFAIIFCTIITLIWFFAPIVTPFFCAYGVAYFFLPIVRRMEQFLPRVVASLFLVVIFYLLAGWFVWTFAPYIYANILDFIGYIARDGQDLIAALSETVNTKLSFLDPNIKISIEKHFNDIISHSLSFIQNIIGKLLHSSVSFATAIFTIVLTPILAFYILRDWDIMTNKVQNLFPKRHREGIKQLFQDIDRILSGYLYGQLIVCSFVTVYYIIGFTAIGVKYNIFLGVLCGLLIIIPYIGIFGAIVTVLIISFMQHNSTQDFLPILILFFCGNIVESNMLSPNIIGEKIQLHPCWILLGIAIGGYTFGFIGMVLSLPVSAVIGVIIRFLFSLYRNSAWFNSTN